MTYPIEMPTAIAAQQSFELQRVDFLSPEAGGRLGAVAAGAPLWLASWTIGKVARLKSDELRAWVARLRGPMRTFLGYDVARRFPLSYSGGFAGMTRAAGGGFDGSAAVWSQSIDPEGDAVVSLTGLPAGFQVAFGDYVGFRWGAGNTRRAMVRAIEPAVASAGGAISIRIEPPVPTLVVPAGAVAHLDNPACVMRLIPDQYELGPISRRLAVESGRVTALQDLRP